MPRIWRAVLLVVLALGSVAPGGEARAAENGDFSLRPVRPPNAPARDRAYVVKTVAPGATLEDALEARNLTDAPLDLVVEPVDATVTTDGAFAAGGSRTATGSWLSVTPSQVRVPAKSGARVKLRIAVPADAAPGDHIAAVVVRRAAPPQGRGTVRVVEQVGVRVYLTVAGGRGNQAAAQARAFEVRALRWVGTAAKRAFEVDVANVGALIVEPLGTLTIARSGLSSSTDLPVLGTVLPGKTTTLRIQSDDPLEPGAYDARVALRAVQGGPEQTASTRFTVQAGGGGEDGDGRDADEDAPTTKGRLPLWLALLAAVALAAVVAQLVRRRLAD